MDARGRLEADDRAVPPGGTSLIAHASLGGIVAVLVAFAATLPIRWYAQPLGLLDTPNDRSSHRIPTARGGGVAMVVAAAAALLVVGALGSDATDAWRVFAAASLVALVGLLDDRFGVAPLARLAAQLAAAALVVWIFGPLLSVPIPGPLYVPLPAALGWIVSVTWIVAVVNFFNFMDGIDGLAAGQAAASCLGVAVAAWSQDALALAIGVAGAAIGFLFHNVPPARIFMGDSGSGFLGFTLAAIPFLAPQDRVPDALLAVAIGLALFLLDPVVTLMRRARQGKNILRSHREHLYQQLVRPDEPAGVVTAAYTATAMVLSMLGGLGYRYPPLLWIGCAAGLLAFFVVWIRAERLRATDPLT